MVLSGTKENKNPRPCGFKSNGRWRKLKTTCLISHIKGMTNSREPTLKLAVCITMYNEDEEQLKYTLTGVLENYNELRNDSKLNFKKH